jgi:hypothetical protein
LRYYLLSFLVATGFGAFWLYERYQDHAEPSEEEAIRQAYAEGEIDEAEMERRFAYVLDDRNQEIVEVLTPANGVGPKTDLARCLNRGNQYVTLERDYFEARESDRSWPSLSH